MGSSIPGVIDYLLDKAQYAAAGVDGEVLVSDGWPAGVGIKMFGIGIDRPPTQPEGTEAEGTLGIYTLGNVGLQEGFGVTGYIYDSSGGTDQKACRDAAFAVFDPFLEAIRDDPSLGGRCVVGMVADVHVQGPNTTEDAAKGRYCLITFTVMCKNLI